MRRIQKALTGRLTKALNELAEEKPEDYVTFWREFGAFVKEGIATNPLSHEDLLPLLRFHSSKSGDEWTSLPEYVARMAEDQKAIYYILGEDLASVVSSPHLDYFKAHDLEVLYLVDPIDVFMAQSLREFEEKPLQNVGDAELELPIDKEEGEEAEEPAIAGPDFDQLTERFKQVLGERVTNVRESKVLRDNPCRLVSAEGDPARHLQRMQRLLNRDFDVPAMILELNRSHHLIQNLAHLVKEQGDDRRIEPIIEQLYENALLLEGLHPNPALMVPRLQALLEAATEVATSVAQDPATET
jgi:molecular chaperone HtpG